MKVWWIAERLLWQNRWLFLLLFLWPYAMAAVLLLPHDRADAADVVSMLHQECLYGLALVAVNGSAAEVLYAGGYPGAVDRYQVNFRVPDGTPPGSVTIRLTSGFIPGADVTIPIR